LEVKKRRLAEIIEKQSQLSYERNKLDLGKIQEILIEGTSKRSKEQLKGKNSANKVVIIPDGHYQKGDYVMVKITDCSPATLFGEVVS
jgi:tRNA-2-methylthio-N6-dimethylallyladenosine synthase